ncbi:acyl carrier protein [Actinoplanes sp. N902-109]|uniref:acyl carrier protein n=1 Tax=Actinoplanes sp. (strain N902-109) TaxID=649831 RepID=UPI0003296878|nr:acyl carrier protein [Actinoplanes sp. N902-109]AGL15834.1 putative acyl carrier protein [Actinoplanes sp. N902-109]
MYEKLSEILVSRFHVDPADLDPTATLETLELDSLDVVELGLVLEKEFGARVTDDELVEAQRLDAILALVERRVARV